MTLLKVCGITRQGDFELAAELGVDYVGFVFFKPSPRYVTPGAAAAIGQKIGGPKRVGVFVNESCGRINQTVALANLDAVQLHGQEDADFYRSINCPCWKAFRIGSLDDVAAMEAYRHWPVLLADTRVEGICGGSGVAMDETLAQEIVARFSEVILAGGISTDNLERILGLAPGGIDLSSSLEGSPGIKSAAKMREFISIFKEVNKHGS